jgi:predicted dehydrogenase
MRAANAISRKNRTAPAAPVPKGDGVSPIIIDATVSSRARIARIALVGIGPSAQAHADALKALGSVTLEAVIDADLERARNFAGRNGGVVAAASLSGLLETQNLDAVHILAPAALRADLACEALGRGLPVLTESPMASDLAGAQVLARACSRSITIFFFIRRLHVWPKRQGIAAWDRW